jgi:hypothetical protein
LAAKWENEEIQAGGTHPCPSLLLIGFWFVNLGCIGVLGWWKRECQPKIMKKWHMGF